MNCKPNDFAMIFRSRAGNHGRLVTCLRLATQAELDDAWFVDHEPVWVIDRYIPVSNGAPVNLCRDSSLRPIRPQSNDARDESLAYLPPVPSKQGETA